MELGQDCGASLVLAPSGHGEGRLSPVEQAALDHAVVSWVTPHRPPPGFLVVELPRLSSTEQIKDDFFHTDPETGRFVGRFLSPAEDESSHGVNTSGWRTITASDGKTVVLQAQKAGGEQEVIGVLYGGTRARVVATPRVPVPRMHHARARPSMHHARDRRHRSTARAQVGSTSRRSSSRARLRPRGLPGRST